MENQRNREVICIQSGQAGVQLGHAMWELLTVEHNLNSNGLINNILDLDTSFQTFFSQTADNQNYPRSLIFDTEPTVIDEIRCGYYRSLFHPDFLINGNEDAANNFARGYYSQSKIMMHTLVDRIREMVEHCDNFQGFLVQSSTAGGTGSGLLTSLMEYLVIEFAGRTSIQLSIYPGTSLSNCIVQPYNVLLTQEKLVYCADLNIIVDNEELYAICCNQLDMKRPSFSNINRVISPILSGLTAPIRFKGMLNSDLSDISTNLIPFPRLHFPFASYSPLMSCEKSDHDLIDTESLTRSMFLRENQFINADLQNGYFMSSAILYRGNCDLSNILKTIQDIKTDKNLHWVDWCPTGFKISHTIQMPVSMPKYGPKDYDKSAMMLSNHNAIIKTFRSLEVPFRILLKRKAYLHWYFGEGMEISEFEHALYETNTISDDYFNIVDHMYNETDYMTSAGSSRSAKNTEDSERNIPRIETKTESTLKSEPQFQKTMSLEPSESLNKTQPLSQPLGKEKEDKRKSTDTENKGIVVKLFQKKSSQKSIDGNPKKIPVPKTVSNNAYADEDFISLEIVNDNNTSNNTSKYCTNMKIMNDTKNSNIRMCYNSRAFTPLAERIHDSKKELKFFTNNIGGANESNVSNQNKVSDEIFEICERNYIRNNFKTFNKKRILRQYDSSNDKKEDHFIKKIYLKNKGIFQKIRNVQEYDLSKSPIS